VSGRIGTGDLESQFAQLARQATSFGVDTDNWQLLPGSDDNGSREPWVVDDGSPHPVLLLGYTKREALAALAIANSILQAIS